MDTISSALGIEPIIYEGPSTLPVTLEPLIEPPTPEQMIEDFNKARANVLDVIKTNRSAMESLVSLADQSQAFKFYDSLAGMMKVMLEANRELMELNAQIKALAGHAGDQVTKIQNNLFVGSTHELQKILKDMQNPQDE